MIMTLDEKLARWLLENHPEDAAALLLTLSDDEATATLDGLAARALGRALHALGPARGARLLQRLELERALEVVEQLPAGSAAALLRRMDADRREALLGSAPEARARSLRLLLERKEGSASDLMETHIHALPGGMLVKDAVRMVERAHDHLLSYVYVVDDDHRLIGVLDLRELFLGRPQQRLSEVMQAEVVALSPELGLRRIVRHPGWLRAHALPVVDGDGVLQGVISYHTLRRLEQEVDAAERGEPAGEVTVAALGDLFWTGISGLVGAVGTQLGPSSRPERGGRR